MTKQVSGFSTVSAAAIVACDCTDACSAVACPASVVEYDHRLPDDCRRIAVVSVAAMVQNSRARRGYQLDSGAERRSDGRHVGNRRLKPDLRAEIGGDRGIRQRRRLQRRRRAGSTQRAW